MSPVGYASSAEKYLRSNHVTTVQSHVIILGAVASVITLNVVDEKNVLSDFVGVFVQQRSPL